MISQHKTHLIGLTMLALYVLRTVHHMVELLIMAHTCYSAAFEFNRNFEQDILSLLVHSMQHWMCCYFGPLWTFRMLFLCIFQQKNFPNAYPTASHSESVLRLNEHVHLLNQLMTWCRKIIPNAIALMQRKIFNRSWKWARMCRINTKHIKSNQKKIIWVLLKKRHSEKSNLQISIKSNVKMNKSIIHISQQYNAG